MTQDASRALGKLRFVLVFLTLSQFYVSTWAVCDYFKDVCATGCQYASVQQAINEVPTPEPGCELGPANVYTIFIDGVVTSDTSLSTDSKSYINFIGRGAGASVIRASGAWFGTPGQNLLDLADSTNVNVRGLTIDAKTNSESLVGTGDFNGIHLGDSVHEGDADKILFDSVEVLAVNYGIWEQPTAAGKSIQLMNSRVESIGPAVLLNLSIWHIIGSDLVARRSGSGIVPTISDVIGIISSSATVNAMVWGSHIHAESSEAGASYNVIAVKGPYIVGSRLSIIGSTLHLKMTTSNSGSATRQMVAFLAPSGGNGTVDLVGTDLLYETPSGSAMNLGSVGGLSYTNTNSNLKINLVGVDIFDGGGTGGSFRADIIGSAFPQSSQPEIRTVGSRVFTVANAGPTSLRTGLGKAFDTTSQRRGTAVLNDQCGCLDVTLSPALPDAAYSVAVSTGAANETIRVTGKQADKFTLTSSNSGSSASVDWILIR